MILRESEIRQKWRNPLKNECSLSWSFSVSEIWYWRHWYCGKDHGLSVSSPSSSQQESLHKRYLHGRNHHQNRWVLTGADWCDSENFHVFKSPDELHVWRQGSLIMEATPGRVLDVGQSRRQFSTLMQGYYLLSIGHISEHSHRWCFRKLRLQPKGI